MVGEPAEAVRPAPGHAFVRTLGKAVVRRVGLDRNPLRRLSDHVETWARVVAATAFLLALPASVSLGFRVHDGLMDIAHRQADTPTRHAAEVIEEPTTVSDRAAATTTATTTATVTWRASTGREFVATAQVPPGTRQGDVVGIWTSLDSAPAEPTSPALTHDDAAKIAALTAAVVVFVAFSAAWVVLQAVVTGLDRRRYRKWDLAWSRLDDAGAR